MARRIMVAVVFIAGVALLFSGCVLPDTGTLRIRNEMTASRVITALYIYEVGTARGSSVASDIDPNETHTEYGMPPGNYTIEADIDFGSETAVESISVEADTFHTVWITDSDVL